MIKGTTAQFKFKIPYTKEELDWVTIKFWQPNNNHPYLPITKKLEHCDSPEGSKELRVSLTVDETMRFSEKYKAKVQLRGRHSDSGTIFGSKPRLITVYPMRDDIVGDDPELPVVDPEGWVILDGKTIVVTDGDQ